MTELYRVDFSKLEAGSLMLEGFATAIHGPCLLFPLWDTFSKLTAPDG